MLPTGFREAVMWWFGVVASVLISPAAGPTYLACEMKSGETPWVVDVAIDEQNQRVTIALPTGRTITRSAMFSPDQVVVPDAPATWTFSRTDLSFRRTFDFMPPHDPGSGGACKVKPAPAKRAF